MFKLIFLAFVLFVILSIIAFILFSAAFVTIGSFVAKLLHKIITNIFGEEKNNG